jgi:aminodeoxychorismate lyase
MQNNWINNRLMPSDEVRVSIEDRGFRFGDGLFETIAVYGGVPYLWPYHMQRLTTGLDALHIAYDTTSLLAPALSLLHANTVENGMLRIAISRGVGSRGYLPMQGIAPTVVMETLERPERPKEPITLWLSQYEKTSPRALPTHCKLAQGLNSTLARMEATEHGCYEALQLNANGHVAEASSANLFWLNGGVLYTPALSTGALAGVTRRRILELSHYKAHEGEYPLEVLQGASAVIATNTSYGVAAVASLHPQEMRWESGALAAALMRLRDADIASDTRALRESLA